MTTQPDVAAPAPAPPAPTPEKPPTKWLLAYRVLGLRLPPQYRAWVAKDVTTKGFLTRRISRNIGWAIVFLALYYVAQAALYDPPALGLRTNMFRAFAVLVAICLLSSGATLVKQTLRWQRVDRHGRPVRPRPKSLAILENDQAVVLGAIALVAFTGVAAAYTQSFVVPDGPLGQRCRKPATATMDRIRSGLKDANTKITNAEEITFGKSKMIGATVDKPGSARKGAIWLVTPDEVYELGIAEQSVTNFEAPTNTSIDRVGAEALRRVADCLGDAIRGS